MRADEEIKVWESNNMSPFDTARKGSSALHAALVRNVKAEVAVKLGKCAASVFIDYEKFFDSIDIPTLLVEAIKVGFPAGKMSFLLQQHLAPRVIQANGFTSRAISVFCSIIAGCLSSVTLTRVFLKNAMTQICNKFPESNPAVFVDDTCLQAIANTMNEILDILVPAVTAFKSKADELKLSISPKSALTASADNLVQILHQELKSYGINFLIDNSARDVGITHTAGRARPNKLMISRFKQRINRTNKTKKLARICRGARKLYSGSALPLQHGDTKDLHCLKPRSCSSKETRYLVLG
jgi:hypothetical protein